MRRTVLAIIAAISLLLCAWGCTAWLRSYHPAASGTPSTFVTQIRLHRALPTVQFDAVNFGDVVDFLRDVSGQKIDVNWRTLSAAGVRTDTPISSHLRNVYFGEAIARIISSAGNLGFATENNIVYILPAGHVEQIHHIERLPAVTGPADVGMKRSIRWVRFRSVPLNEALEDLHQKCGVRISASWTDLRPAGIDQLTPVSLDLQNATAADALSVMLRSLAATQDLQFHVGASEVVVSTQGGLDRQLGTVNFFVNKVALMCSLAAVVLALILLLWIWKKVPKTEENKNAWYDWIGLLPVTIAVAMVAIATWKHGPPFWESISGSSRWTLTAHHGVLRLWHTPADPATPYQDVAHLGKAKAPDERKLFDRAGWSIRWSGSPFNSWVVSLPLWGFAPLMAFAPLLWLVLAIRRRRRYGKGLCPKCGYDLRASTGRCPECGTPISIARPSPVP